MLNPPAGPAQHRRPEWARLEVLKSRAVIEVSYLCFAFALTGLPGFLIRCPFGCLGDKTKAVKINKDDKRAEKQSAEVFGRHRKVTQQLTVANTVDVHRKDG